MPDEEGPRRLARARRAYVMAAAGCGKTEAIVRAVELGTAGRQLILTHTHAGVAALRRRLDQRKISHSRYALETIAGWALRFSAAYPRISKIPTTTPTGDDWQRVYPCAERLLRRAFMRRVIQSSYAGAYVDEYQDCTTLQHQVVVALSEHLPCRVLGDPLQGIFDFGRDPLISWTDVAAHFEPLPELVTPHRWLSPEANPELGRWLQDVRPKLLAGEPIDLSQAPITWIEKTPQGQAGACLRQLDSTGDSIVAIHAVPAQCHALARKLGGRYSSMEEMDCRDLLTFVDQLATSRGLETALHVIAFAKDCISGLAAPVTSLHSTLSAGRIPRVGANCPLPPLYAAVADLCLTTGIGPIRTLMKRLAEVPGVHLYRMELWREAQRTLDAYSSGEHASLRDAAVAVRNVTRHAGRRPERRTVSRTLLIKGLEYDRAIILDADALDAKNLYVALTRARKALVVLSASKVVRPKP